MKNLSTFGVAAAILLTAHTSVHSGEPAQNAAAYLNAALNLMQAYSVHRKEIDWNVLREQAFVYASGARTAQDTYPAIVFACTQLKVHQGICLQQPTGTPVAIQLRSTAIQHAAEEASRGRLLTTIPNSPFAGRASFKLVMLSQADKKYAYLVVTTAMGSHAESADPQYRHRWAEILYGLVNKGIQAGAQGWILDIRGMNDYADWGPLFAGLQPLLGNGTLLRFQSTHSGTTSIRNGLVREQVRFANPYVEERIDESVSFSQKDSPIVVLIDRGTEGASEILGMALKARSRTYFIGQRTGGFINSGASWPLPDGALLWIVTGDVFDRNGRAYPEGIKPDLEVANPPKIPAIASDSAVLAAENWLATQIR